MKRADVERLVNKYGPLFQRDLGLDEMNIQWHVLVGQGRDEAALTTFDNKDIIDISIYYDQQRDKTDCLASIYHELLHVLFYQMSVFIRKKDRDVFDVMEEDIIRDLERFFVKYFKVPRS